MTPVPKIGQIWADNDPRSKGRTIRIVSVNERFVQAETLTPAKGYISETSTGRITRIRVDRLRPSTTGYRLMQDVS